MSSTRKQTVYLFLCQTPADLLSTAYSIQW